MFAQVSDIHIGQDREDGGAGAAERARRVMAYLNELPGPIDAVLVLGDLDGARTHQPIVVPWSSGTQAGSRCASSWRSGGPRSAPGTSARPRARNTVTRSVEIPGEV